MVVVGAAACAAEHVEFRLSVAAHDIEEMMVYAVQQVEAFEALPLEDAAVACASVPGSDDVQADGDFGALGGASQVCPLHGHEFDERGGRVEHFFLFDEFHLFVPEVERFDGGFSRFVCELFQPVNEAEVKELSHDV